MQRELKKTKITINEDFPTSASSSIYGANINANAFNIDFIVRRDPILAIKILELSRKAWALRNKPELEKNDENYVVAQKRMFKLMERNK